MMGNRFYFNGQLHIPQERVEETLEIAIARGLDALIFTDYNKTFNFYYLTENR